MCKNWCFILGVFRSIGPKPTSEELAKKRSRPFWLWHEFKEVFICCAKPKRSALIDVMAQPPPPGAEIYIHDGRESRISSGTTGSAESTTILRDFEIGKKIFPFKDFCHFKKQQRIDDYESWVSSPRCTRSSAIFASFSLKMGNFTFLLRIHDYYSFC